MGYTTKFEGRFAIDKALLPEQCKYLRKFSETRRMKRDVQKASALPDPVRIGAKLAIGEDAAYFAGGIGFKGQDKDESVVDFNKPPTGQPGLWCQWIPDEDGRFIRWDGSEKFYDYIDWIKYLAQHFLEPWDYKINGSVKWHGESVGDHGIIHVEDNVIVAEIG